MANADPRTIVPIVIVIAAVTAGAITFLILFYNRKQRQDQVKYKPFRGPNALVQNGDVNPERLAQLEQVSSKYFRKYVKYIGTLFCGFNGSNLLLDLG